VLAKKRCSCREKPAPTSSAPARLALRGIKAAPPSQRPPQVAHSDGDIPSPPSTALDPAHLSASDNAPETAEAAQELLRPTAVTPVPQP
jgi:hypothetical protein